MLVFISGHFRTEYVVPGPSLSVYVCVYLSVVVSNFLRSEAAVAASRVSCRRVGPRRRPQGLASAKRRQFVFNNSKLFCSFFIIICLFSFSLYQPYFQIGFDCQTDLFNFVSCCYLLILVSTSCTCIYFSTSEIRC